MTDFTPRLESAELHARNQSTAGRLFVAADAFLFLGFLFAYLYLRTLNNHGLWNPPGQNPSGAMGAVVLVLVIVTAALIHVASRRLAAAGPAAFRAPAAAALLVGLVAMLLAGSQLFRPGFSPSHAGGFGSVFIGFIAFDKEWIHQLYVSPQFQSKGIGKQLLAIPQKTSTVLRLWVLTGYLNTRPEPQIRSDETHLICAIRGYTLDHP